MNDLQEIFLVTFSILYGVMLQSLIGFNLFQFGDWASHDSIPFKKVTEVKYKTIFKEDDRELDGDDRRRIKKRIIFSMFLFNIIPALYLFGVYFGLSFISDDILPAPIEVTGLFIVGVFLMSFFPFFIYRIFHRLVLGNIYWLYEKDLKRSVVMRLSGSGGSKKGQSNAILIYLEFLLFGLLFIIIAFLVS
jgi:hypothetical protein